MDTASEIIRQMERYRRIKAGEAPVFTLGEMAAMSGQAPIVLNVPAASTGGWWANIDCDNCPCDEIERWIRSQQDVIRGLQQYSDFDQPFPEHQELANAAGARSDAYKNASQCIRKVVDEMEGWHRTLGPAIELGLAVIWDQGPSARVRELKRDIEIARSQQFVELLKALCFWCCGLEAYTNMLERLSAASVQSNDSQEQSQMCDHEETDK